MGFNPEIKFIGNPPDDVDKYLKQVYTLVDTAAQANVTEAEEEQVLKCQK